MMTFTSTTYLKNVDKYIYYQYTKDNLHITVKKILEVEPFIINENGQNIKILDNDYYVMEIIPMSKNYICRIHLDNSKNIIERYFIMSLKNSFIDNIPTFDNLKIAYVCCHFQKKIYNEEYIEKMYKEKQISLENYTKIKNELQVIISEINNKKNQIYNLDYKKIIEKMEGEL